MKIVYSPEISVFTYKITGSRDRVVGILTGYGLDDRGVGVRVCGVKNFLFSMSSRPTRETSQLPIKGVRGVFPRG
jgi:hypothetical protein